MAQKQFLLYRPFIHTVERDLFCTQLCKKVVLSIIAHGAFMSLLLAIQDTAHIKKCWGKGAGGEVVHFWALLLCVIVS